MNLHTATLHFTRRSVNYYPELRLIIKVEYRKSSIKPPSTPPYHFLLINDGLYLSITTVKRHLDWSRMVYSAAESTELFLILGRMTSNFLTVSFFSMHSSSLWRTDTIVFAK